MMLIYIGLAIATWFLISWIVRLKKKRWVLVVALLLTALLAFVAFLFMFAVDPVPSGRSGVMAFCWLYVAGCWSAIREYRRSDNPAQVRAYLKETGQKQTDRGGLKDW